MQPLPVVKQPARKIEHAELVDIVVGASVQTKGLHTDDPPVVLFVHGPSEPIIPVHPAACV